MNLSGRRAWLFTPHSPQNIVSDYRSVSPEDVIIAIDGGLLPVQRLGLQPQLIIGDMDSVEIALLEQYSATPRLEHPRKKDETDTELAVCWCMEQCVGEIIICNDLGGRFDHALGVIQNMLLAHRRGVYCRVESASQVALFISGEWHCGGFQGWGLSLIAWESEARFSVSRGLEYPVDALYMRAEQSMGISNSVISPDAYIVVEQGVVLAVLTKY